MAETRLHLVISPLGSENIQGAPLSPAGRTPLPDEAGRQIEALRRGLIPLLQVLTKRTSLTGWSFWLG